MKPPFIVPRAVWGARYANGAGPAPLPAVDGVYLHHSTTVARNGYDAIRQLEQIGQDRFGAGISYTFAVNPAGTIYEGHSIDRLGSHTKGHNTNGRGIVLVGDYTRLAPTPAQITAVAQLVAHGIRQRWWPGLTGGHRDVRATACPGDAAYAAIPTIRRRAADLLAGAPTTPPGDLTMAQYDEIIRRLDRIESKAEEARRLAGSAVGWSKAHAHDNGITAKQAGSFDPTND